MALILCGGAVPRAQETDGVRLLLLRVERIVQEGDTADAPIVRMVSLLLLEAHKLKDAAMVEGLFSASPDVFFISPGGSLNKGRDSIRRSFQLFFDHLESIQGDIDFIANQAENGRTKYADAIARNYPLGTGVTEAAAKTIVNVRMKRAGSRFDQHGGQTVLLFRSALLSDRFNTLSEQLERTYRANVEAA